MTDTNEELVKRLEMLRPYMGAKGSLTRDTNEETLDAAISALTAQPQQEPVAMRDRMPAYQEPPANIIDAAMKVSQWAAENNWKQWRIGHCCSEDYTSQQPGVREGMLKEALHVLVEPKKIKRRKDFLPALESLLERATKGKWIAYWRVTDGAPDCGVFAEPRDGQVYSVCRCPHFQTRKQWDIDSELIAFLANHAKAIAGVVKEAKKVATDFPVIGAGLSDALAALHKDGNLSRPVRSDPVP